MGIKLVNGIETPLTAEEEAEIVEKNSDANRTARKLVYNLILNNL